MRRTTGIFWIAVLLVVACLSAHAVKAEDRGFDLLPGDVLQISVWKEEGMDQEVLVLPDGTITFPLAGTLDVRGMNPADLQAAIRDKLENTIPDAAVTVSVKAPLGHKASVIGQVAKPGEVILDAMTGVMQALSKTGGLTPYADEDSIIIIRTLQDGKKEKIAFPYSAITSGRELDKDISLMPGDVVVVPSSGLF